MNRILTAIIYCETPQVNGSQFLKYRNIKNTTVAKERFLRFAAKFPGAKYVNWYDKHTRQFLERQKIETL